MHSTKEPYRDSPMFSNVWKFEKYACTLDNLSFYCLNGFLKCLMFWKLEIACSTMEKESSKTTFAFVPPQKSCVFFHEWQINETELRNGLSGHGTRGGRIIKGGQNNYK